MDADLIRMGHLAASLLHKKDFDLLMQFKSDDDLMLIDTGEALGSATRLFNHGLVSKTLAGGHLFIQLRPIGILLRTCVDTEAVPQ